MPNFVFRAYGRYSCYASCADALSWGAFAKHYCNGAKSAGRCFYENFREDNGPLWMLLETGANLTVVNGICRVSTKSSLDHLLWFEHGCLVMEYTAALQMVLRAEKVLAPTLNGGVEGRTVESVRQTPRCCRNREKAEEYASFRWPETNECSRMGMLDSGASHPLRSLRPGEELPQQKVMVSLVVGCVLPKAEPW